MTRTHRILRVTGGRVAWTNTSRIPDAKVREVIRFVAREVDLDGVVIHVKRAGSRRATYGRAYQRIPQIASLEGLRRIEWRFLIVVTDEGTMLDFVDTMAHEAKHIEGYRERKRCGERRARNFGGVMAERWEARFATV